MEILLVKEKGILRESYNALSNITAQWYAVCIYA